MTTKKKIIPPHPVQVCLRSTDLTNKKTIYLSTTATPKQLSVDIITSSKENPNTSPAILYFYSHTDRRTSPGRRVW